MCVCVWCEQDIVSGPVEHIGGQPMHSDCAFQYCNEFADEQERDPYHGDYSE